MSEDGSSSRPESGSGYSDSDSDQDVQNYRHILRSLINNGQLHLVSPVYENYIGPRMPKIKAKPNTKILDKSAFSTLTKQSSGIGEPKHKKLKENNVARMMIGREEGSNGVGFSQRMKCQISNMFLPNKMSLLDTSPGKVFCGVFSKSGNRFITASQDRSIRIYDSAGGPYKFLHSISARDVGWSIIDVAFSPDNEHFVYSTWSSALHLCSVNEDNDHQEPLGLLRSSRRFCVFSVVFSSDGKELLGGANDGCLYIYDLERHKRSLKIPAHEYDVNSVVFADNSSQIIYSGGDDGHVKVWDRRTLIETSPKPVGVLAGHMDGITFIDSKGDGRYLISNSKDQSIKLWDVRVFSGSQAAENTLKAVTEQTWDYRWQEVPKKLYSRSKLDGDTSVMTYKGHVVIKTLVRCRFSPLETTGQRYIYTGCGRGRVVVYDALTGEIVEALRGHVACVRDVDWHPTRNEILSSSWDGTVGKWVYSNMDFSKEKEKPEKEMEDKCSDSETRDRRRSITKRRMETRSSRAK